MAEKIKKEKFVSTPRVTTIDVEVRVNDLYGGRPLHNDNLSRWLESLVVKGKLTKKDAENISGEPVSDAPETTDETEAAHTTGFKITADGTYYIEARNIKAMFKESAVVLGYISNVSPVERHYFQTGFIIDPVIIETGRKEPDRIEQDVKHVENMGRRLSSIANALVLDDVTISFLVRFLTGTKFSLNEQKIRAMLNHAADFVGLGANRSQQRGRFKVVKFDVLETIDSLTGEKIED